MIEAIAHDQTLQSILLICLVAALADFVAAVLASLATHSFNALLVSNFVTTHLLNKVLPLVLLAIVASLLGHITDGLPDAPVLLTTAVGAAWTAAVAGVIAYVVTTLASLQATVQGGETRLDAQQDAEAAAKTDKP